MIVLVFGGRDFDDYNALRTQLDAIHFGMTPITRVVSGGARGADALGEYWAHVRGVEVKRYPANWEAHGRKAGALRNQQMLDCEAIEIAVACPGGKGTADMLRRLATRPHIHVWRLP